VADAHERAGVLTRPFEGVGHVGSDLVGAALDVARVQHVEGLDGRVEVRGEVGRHLDGPFGARGAVGGDHDRLDHERVSAGPQ
jgi:hypothetical protein